MEVTAPGRRFDTALHILDRQIIDPDGRLVAKVDDLELAQRDDGRWVLVALLTGPGALGQRYGGPIGRWVLVIWRRLRPDANPSPGRIPMTLVTHIDSAVHVSRSVDELSVHGFEDWLRQFVISRLPGATHEPE